MKKAEDTEPTWLALGNKTVVKLRKEEPKEKKETKTILRKASQWQQPQKKIASN